MGLKILRAALAVAVLGAPVVAQAGKPKVKPAAVDSSALTKLKVLVDKTAVLVDEFIRDVKAAGDDGDRLTAVGRRFQTVMQATEGEMEALQKSMDTAQRAAGEDYGRDKLGPRIDAMQAALELVQQAAEAGDDATMLPEHAPPAEKFRAQIAKLAGDADALVEQARAAGKDAIKREAVRQQSAKLGAQRNAAYQVLRQEAAEQSPARLFKEAEKTLEAKLQRADRLLRMALVAPCTPFEEQRLTVAEMAADARRLLDELAQVNDAAGLESLKTRYAHAIAGLDTLAWAKLTPDERQELAALVTESVSAATDQFMQRAEALQQKFAP